MTTLNAFEFVKHALSEIVELSEEEWHAFEKRASVKHVKKREHFLLQGEVCKNLGIITSGYVRHYYVTEEKEITNDFNFEGMITGSYQSFHTGIPARYNVIAMEDVTLVTYSWEVISSLYEKYPNWQKLGLNFLSKMFQRKLLREESFLIDKPEQRYMALVQNQPHILQRVPLQYIAAYLGVTPETLSRIRSKKL